MKITVLGSGTFFVTPEQTASSFLLEVGNQKILVDCGPGTLYRISQLGIKPEDINCVFLTHFHPDHSSDLFPLFMNVRLGELLLPNSLPKFPTFYGPEGFSKFLLDYSNLTELKAYQGCNRVTVVDFQPEHRIGSLVVKTFKVVHSPFNFPARAYALRFEVEDKIITFSGDSAMCQGVKDAALNSDLFICDASFPKGTVGSSPGMVHMNTLEIGTVCREANVKKVLLTHFYPQYKDINLISQVKETYSGEVANCTDLMEVNL